MERCNTPVQYHFEQTLSSSKIYFHLQQSIFIQTESRLDLMFNLIREFNESQLLAVCPCLLIRPVTAIYLTSNLVLVFRCCLVVQQPITPLAAGYGKNYLKPLSKYSDQSQGQCWLRESRGILLFIVIKWLLVRVGSLGAVEKKKK